MEINGFKTRPLWVRRLFGTFRFGSWAVYRDVHSSDYLAEVYDEFRDTVKSHRFRSLEGAKHWAAREVALMEKGLQSQLEAIS